MIVLDLRSGLAIQCQYMGIHFIVQESITREVFRIEADSEEQAFEVAVRRYDDRKKSVAESFETVYRTVKHEDLVS